MSEVMTMMALVIALSMIMWWKWLRGGDMFSTESSFGFIGFVAGAYFSYKTFGLADLTNDISGLLFFVLIPVICYMIAESIVSVLTFRRRSFRTLSLSNIEERTKKMQELGVKKMLKKMKAQSLDVSKRGNTLYLIDKLVPNYSLKYLVYDDPSSPDKTYGCFVPSHFNKADEAMAWKFQITTEEYNGLEVEA